MVDLKISKKCPKCKDTFYNNGDMESIKKEKVCVYCKLEKKK